MHSTSSALLSRGHRFTPGDRNTNADTKLSLQNHKCTEITYFKITENTHIALYAIEVYNMRGLGIALYNANTQYIVHSTLWMGADMECIVDCSCNLRDRWS